MAAFGPYAVPMKICIAGGPRTGKTTLGDKLDADCRHTDDLIGKLEWSELSAEVVRWMLAHGPWCIEGVRVVHALRKFTVLADTTLRPCDVIYWLDTPMEPLSKGQVTMTKAVGTVWSEILPELRRRGVEIRRAP